MAGKFMAEQLGGKGKVILLRYAVGSASTENRENGFLKALEAYPEIELISSDQYAVASQCRGVVCIVSNWAINVLKAC